jgi:hypothetical protein
MNVKDYLDRVEIIRQNELLSVTSLVLLLNISFNTYKRLQLNPEICALKTMRKLKLFVEKWEAKNMSHTH